MDALKGITTAAISSLLIAIIFAFTFRIPIPLAGYIGPFGEISTYGKDVIDVLKLVLLAWGFYGVFGGFIILLIIGVVTGTIVGKTYHDSIKKNRMIILWTASVSAIPVSIMSVLDYLIGPW